MSWWRYAKALLIAVILAMSTPTLRVELSTEEDRTLQELRVVSGVPQRTKDRAEALRLSHRGWTPHQIAEYLGWQVATARTAIHRWQRAGLCGLWVMGSSSHRSPTALYTQCHDCVRAAHGA